MSVKIRLKRMGRRNQPFFRVIVQDGRKAPGGRFLETLGWYDPNRTGLNYELKMDRLDYWVGCGAQLSNTVSSLSKMARSGKAPKEKAAPAPAPDEIPEPVEAVEEVAPVAEEAAPAAEEAAPVAEKAAEEAPAEEVAESSDA